MPFLSQLTLTPSPEVSPPRRNWHRAEPAPCAHSTASHLLPHKTKKPWTQLMVRSTKGR